MDTFLEDFYIILSFFFNILWTPIVIYLRNKNQQDALFTFNLLQ
jgi:hypothetical protein